MIFFPLLFGFHVEVGGVVNHFFGLPDAVVGSILVGPEGGYLLVHTDI